MSLWTLPNILSMLRIVLTPVVIALLMQRTKTAFWLSLGLFTLAALTDLWDGYLARLLRNVSAFGAYLDPLADKVLTLSLFAAFAHEGIMTLGLFFIFVSRDILLTGLRSIVAACGVAWQTSRIAKWKTFLQFVVLYGGYAVIAVKLGIIPLPFTSVQIGFLFVVWSIAVLTMYTALDYFVSYGGEIESVINKNKLVQKTEQVLLGIATMGLAWVRLPAPGTVGSVVATVAAYAVMPYLGVLNAWVGLGIGLLFFCSWICASRAAYLLGDADPGIVVIDEVIAMFMICYLVPLPSAWWYVLACGVFRFFDILKPYPIGLLDRNVKGGLGIMLDDVAAALYTVLVMLVVMHYATLDDLAAALYTVLVMFKYT